MRMILAADTINREHQRERLSTLFRCGWQGVVEARRLLELALDAAIKMRLPEAGTIQALLDEIGAGQRDADMQTGLETA